MQITKTYSKSERILPIFCDQDGVLAAFDKKAIELMGENYKEKMNQAIWNELQEHPNFFKDLEELPGARKLMDFLYPRFNVKILTAIPFRGIFPNVTTHKREWIQSRWPGVDVFFGPFAMDKQYYAEKGFILIDDLAVNCDQWESKGGTAIWHKNAADTIKQLQTILDIEGAHKYETPPHLKEIYQ